LVHDKATFVPTQNLVRDKATLMSNGAILTPEYFSFFFSLSLFLLMPLSSPMSNPYTAPYVPRAKEFW
jgi:hypothetical protein